jgi:hypothetical protein
VELFLSDRVEPRNLVAQNHLLVNVGLSEWSSIKDEGRATTIDNLSQKQLSPSPDENEPLTYFGKSYDAMAKIRDALLEQSCLPAKKALLGDTTSEYKVTMGVQLQPL